MNVLIVYTSLSGNTDDLSRLLKKSFEEYGHTAHTFDSKQEHSYENYDLVLFGSYTWADGKLPVAMRKYLRRKLIEEETSFPICAVFGTGETQFGARNYCRAVDEMEYHLSKKTRVLNKLKIEQNPIGKEKTVKDFVRKILEETQQ